MKLVILDRDDTLIRVPAGRRYLYGDDEILLADGAATFVQNLVEAGIDVVIATNQQGVALAEYPEMTIESVDRFHRRLLDELERHGASVARVYVCPHSVGASCACRKPLPGLYLEAMGDFGSAPEETTAIGDQWRDLQAARAAGIRSLYLIGREPLLSEPPPDLEEVRIVSSFDECLSPILG